jgi:hypothetical protein
LEEEAGGVHGRVESPRGWMRNIAIIPLARKKAARRGIPETWIRETIEAPGQVVEGYRGRRIAQKKYLLGERQYLLRVVYEETNDTWYALTAYLTSQVARYWREKNDED